MRIHILGISGTFMSGLALIAKHCGHIVTGSDQNVYPPMSLQLNTANISYCEGFSENNIPRNVDLVIIGNVIKRGNKELEYILDHDLPYLSGPEWLYQEVLKKKHVIAVSGTHGKTTTSSLLTFILDRMGLNPSFLIGGKPENFEFSVRMTDSPYFVIEADEYDTAYFDKRSKFIHYHPKTLVLNNLEFDHADIFADLTQIKLQFHYLLRTLAEKSTIIHNVLDKNINDLLDMGCWSKTQSFGDGFSWHAEVLKNDGSHFKVLNGNNSIGEIKWDLLGNHNIMNALAAIATISSLNLEVRDALPHFRDFKNVKRRLQVRGKINDITIYDDFAHHPTAIASTLQALRARIGGKKLIAILEFGSYTMRMGHHKDAIVDSLKDADLVFCKNTKINWGLENLFKDKKNSFLFDDASLLVKGLIKKLNGDEHIVVMTNSNFENIHEKLMQAISEKYRVSCHE